MNVPTKRRLFCLENKRAPAEVVHLHGALCAELVALLVASTGTPPDHAVDLDRIDMAVDGELKSIAVAV